MKDFWISRFRVGVDFWLIGKIRASPDRVTGAIFFLRFTKCRFGLVENFNTPMRIARFICREDGIRDA